MRAKERARRLKVDEKENQLQEWRNEVEEFSRLDEVSLAVANDGPELEDRDGLFADLQQPRPWDEPDFVPPELESNVMAWIRQRCDDE